MPTYKTKQFSNIRPLYTPEDACVCGAVADIEFPSTALIANDLILLATIPAGVKLADYKFVLPDVDSNGTPAFAWSFGVLNAGGTDLGTVLASGITTGQASGVHRAGNADHLTLDATVDRVLAIKVTTAAATYAGSGKRGKAILDLEG